MFLCITMSMRESPFVMLALVDVMTAFRNERRSHFSAFKSAHLQMLPDFVTVLVTVLFLPLLVGLAR